MRKLTICTGLAVLALAVPAQANRDNQDESGEHGHGHGKGHRHREHGDHRPKDDCTVRTVRFHARGFLIASQLTQTAGQGTPTRRDDRYSGTLQVDVREANHGAPTGVQTYTLDNARVKFYDADHDGKPDQPKAGDIVKLHGKITKLPKRCNQTGFTPTITVKRVRFKPASGGTT
jgi:hypothetical protein